MPHEEKDQLRNYDADQPRVRETYRQMYQNQNCLFVRNKKRIYTSAFGYTDRNGLKIRKTIREVFSELDSIIDESDPDTGLPQTVHAYQTAESARTLIMPDSGLLRAIPAREIFSDAEWDALSPEMQQAYAGDIDRLYPEITDWSWLPLMGFLHDMGKVLASKKWGGLPQWAVVGDTFPVGAPLSEASVYFGQAFHKENPDLFIEHSELSKFGRYDRHCGFKNVEMSFGHDEYCYAVLNRTFNKLPEHALYIVRFHSFYAWHTPRHGERGYTELADAYDWRMLPLLKLFQKNDLYSKKHAMPDQAALDAYYDGLIKRYIPGRPDTDRDMRPFKIGW